MQKLKIILLILTVLMAAALFSGCSAINLDTEALMEAPALNEEQSKLKKALTEAAGENIQMKYVSYGENNSAFVFGDLDGDNAEEVLAFYTTDGDSTRINILKQNGTDWHSLYEASGFSGDIENVRFMNCGGGKNLLLIKWGQEIGIYELTGNKLEAVYSSTCDGIFLEDMDMDGFEDIIIFSGSYVGHSKVNILYHKDGKLVSTGYADINSPYSAICSTVIGDMGNGVLGFFIDSNLYENIFLTEIISLENGETIRSTIASFIKLTESDYEYNDHSGIQVITGYGKRGIYARNTGALCMDIDGDGIIEFPVEVREDTASTDNKALYLIDYMKYDGEDSSSVLHGFYCEGEKWFLTLPKDYDGKVNIRFDSETDTVAFTDLSTGEPILSVYGFLSTNSKPTDEKYILLGEKGNYCYYAEIFADAKSPFYITKESLESGLMFLN